MTRRLHSCGSEAPHEEHQSCPGYPPPDQMMTDGQYLGWLRSAPDAEALEALSALREAAAAQPLHLRLRPVPAPQVKVPPFVIPQLDAEAIGRRLTEALRPLSDWARTMESRAQEAEQQAAREREDGA